MQLKKIITIFVILISFSLAYAQSPFKAYRSNIKSWQKPDKGKGGKKVFTNPAQITSKSSNGKNTTALPDVCFTPPSSPTGENSINEPNLSDSDSKGSKSTKNDLNNQENNYYPEKWYYNPNPLKAFNNELKLKSGQTSISDRYNIKYLQKK